MYYVYIFVVIRTIYQLLLIKPKRSYNTHIIYIIISIMTFPSDVVAGVNINISIFLSLNVTH